MNFIPQKSNVFVWKTYMLSQNTRSKNTWIASTATVIQNVDHGSLGSKPTTMAWKKGTSSFSCFCNFSSLSWRIVQWILHGKCRSRNVQEEKSNEHGGDHLPWGFKVLRAGQIRARNFGCHTSSRIIGTSTSDSISFSWGTWLAAGGCQSPWRKSTVCQVLMGVQEERDGKRKGEG